MSSAPKTAVFITHDIAEAVFVADQVIVFANRPSRVRTVVDIDLPRPRTADMKLTDEFADVVERIRMLLDDLPKVTGTREAEGW
jgi:NitT/TauT family transport system ATP-binding protein